mgnify:FL=1
MNVWSDKWAKGNSLRELSEGPLTLEEASQFVIDIFFKNGRGWEALSFELLEDIKGNIKAIPIQLYGNMKDSHL